MVVYGEVQGWYSQLPNPLFRINFKFSRLRLVRLRIHPHSQCGRSHLTIRSIPRLCGHRVKHQICKRTRQSIDKFRASVVVPLPWNVVCISKPRLCITLIGAFVSWPRLRGSVSHISYQANLRFQSRVHQSPGLVCLDSRIQSRLVTYSSTERAQQLNRIEGALGLQLK